MSNTLERSSSGTALISTSVGFAMMCVGMFMAILDVQVVATSLPTIQGALDIAPDQMSWVQTAYLIAEVIAIPLTGFLTRALGMRWLFVSSISVFTLASVGCAASGSFSGLIAWRVLQGFSGGTLIPSVFSAVFLLFSVRRQGVATTLAGVLAVLAPTVGPIVGGWITETYSWHWLFLINVAPGIVSAVLAGFLLPRAPFRLGEVRTLDIVSLILLSIMLAALEIALKEAPMRGWNSGLVLGLLALSLASSAAFVRRTLGTSQPVVNLRTFSDRSFAIGCVLSFVLGIGLFGSVYLMPVFLAFVRGHNALEIGVIMLVTGATQLLIAPIAVALEQRVDARLLTFAGFGLFATGLALSGVQTPQTDFDGMFWPQVIRGLAIMFCLLPPTRLALGHLEPTRVPDASGLFNLMRNLGGAIGLAIIDTVIYTRSPVLGAAITARLQAGDVDTAKFIGIPVDMFAARPAGLLDGATQALVQPLTEKAALAQAINEAWIMIALLTVAALLCVPFAKTSPPPRPTQVTSVRSRLYRVLLSPGMFPCSLAQLRALIRGRRAGACRAGRARTGPRANAGSDDRSCDLAADRGGALRQTPWLGSGPIKFLAEA
jgi:DHA2 family multidrug resistance protein